MQRNESEPLLGKSDRALSRRFSDFWRGGGSLTRSSGTTGHERDSDTEYQYGSGSASRAGPSGSFPPSPTVQGAENFPSSVNTANPSRESQSDSPGHACEDVTRLNDDSVGGTGSIQSSATYNYSDSRQLVRSPISEEAEESGSYVDSFVGSVRSLHSLPATSEQHTVTAGEQLPQDDLCILQACVFIEDAFRYHSIDHKVDRHALRLYQIYYSRPVQWCLYSVIFVLHVLAFFEKPSSLTWTSDLRAQSDPPHPPCGLTESIELLCLLTLLLNLVARIYFRDWRQIGRHKWMIAYSVVITVSLIDWFISVGTLCSYSVRVRRMLRPFFLLQNSTLMKKTVNCLRRTLPQVFSVLLLLFVHLYFFSLFGMLLFPKEPGSHNTTDITHYTDKESKEQRLYFANLGESFINLLVLLTTANNPDVSMPAYSLNRLYALFFIVFLIIGLLCLMNMLTAVIYNQFRGYFSNSLQASLFRRRLAITAAFEVLRQRRVALTFRSQLGATSSSVAAYCLTQVLEKAGIPKLYKESMIEEIQMHYEGQLLNYGQFQSIFKKLDADIRRSSRPAIRDVRRPWLQLLQSVVAHKYFTYVSCSMACLNVLCITIELAAEFEHIRYSHSTPLALLNALFIAYYLLEQSLRVWALGWRLYCWDRGNIFDGVITLALVILELCCLITYGLPFSGRDELVNDRYLTLWDFVKLICILIMVRLVRIFIAQVKTMYLVAVTLIDLIKNLTPFAGLLLVIYYSYALLGMVLFEGRIVYTQNVTNESLPGGCGSYRQLEYWANNFDDFAAALLVLWDVMIVNNWHVFLQAYSFVMSGWSQLYFIVWWLMSVVIILNLFTALILENFIMKWDRLQQHSTSQLAESYVAEYMDVHDMFREDLLEPSEESLMVELRQHPHLHIDF